MDEFECYIKLYGWQLMKTVEFYTNKHSHQIKIIEYADKVILDALLGEMAPER